MTNRWVLLAVFFLVLTVGGMGADKGIAADNSIKLEINKLETQGDFCRVYFVFVNGLDLDLSSFKSDLVFFDLDGVISSRLMVEAAPLLAGKTQVKLFDVAAIRCDAIGRVLLNDVSACQSAGQAVPDCTTLTRTMSRTDVEFIK